MKKFKKVFAILLTAAMVMAMSLSAFAQDKTLDPADADNATITISNAAKGVEYKAYKLFDATVTGTANGSIAYQGTIPSSLSAYFEVITGADASTNYIKKKDGISEEDLFAALKTWAEGADEVISETSTGGALNFKGLPYGYYVVTSTQGTGAAITVTSTNPNATIEDKNTTTVIDQASKKVDDTDVYIGETVEYTVEFGTANYDGTTKKQIVKYTIEDTLPEFLSNVTVTSLTIGGTAYTVEGETPQFVSKKIEIPWAENGVNLYDNGAKVVIKYTAVVNDKVAVDGTVGNANTVTITATDKDGGSSNHEEQTDKIFTYAAAIQKIDENKKPLAGAKFAVKGLSVSGSAGNYTVTGYDETSTELGDVMECDSEGQLVILGLPSDAELKLIETEAPNGYNKLTDEQTLKAVKTGEIITSSQQTIYYDENGHVTDQQTETSYTKNTYNVNLLKEASQVENKKGNTLPSTGGIGTTIFYVVGAILVIGAGVVMITRRRMSA